MRPNAKVALRRRVVVALVVTVCSVVCGRGIARAQAQMSFLGSAGRLDRMAFKASASPATPIAPEIDGVSFSFANVAGVVFAQTLAPAELARNTSGTKWKFAAERAAPGIHGLTIAKKTRSDGRVGYTVKLRLDADLAAADPLRSGLSVDDLAAMKVEFLTGDDAWVVAAVWERTGNGWRRERTPATSRYLGSAKRVFVSSECFFGSLGGLGGADAKCQALADAAGLGGTFTAWLADAYDGPAFRLPHASEPYVRVDRAVVARDWMDLVDGELGVSIAYDETGLAVADDPECGATVWTNTTTLGTVALSDALEFACYEWTLALFSRWGLVGDATATGPEWTDGGALTLQRCSSLARIYCFER